MIRFVRSRVKIGELDGGVLLASDCAMRYFENTKIIRFIIVWKTTSRTHLTILVTRINSLHRIVGIELSPKENIQVPPKENLLTQ